MRKPLHRLFIIQARIMLLQEIIADFSGDLNKALLDEKVFKPAILMHLVAIAEQINKLKEDNAFEILDKFSRSDLKGLNDMRNFIAHDYEGLDMSVVESALKHGLPSLRESIDAILNSSK